MKIDISNLFYTTLPRSVCLSPLHSPPSHSCTRAPCTSVSQWPAATGSQAHCHFRWPVKTGSQAHHWIPTLAVGLNWWIPTVAVG